MVKNNFIQCLQVTKIFKTKGGLCVTGIFSKMQGRVHENKLREEDAIFFHIKLISASAFTTI